MKIFALLVGLLLVANSPAAAQGRHTLPTPPQPLGAMATSKPGITHVSHLNAPQLQRDARELSALAQSIPADIDNINRGLFPKDLVDKLKRIEKLTKQLRGQIAP